MDALLPEAVELLGDFLRTHEALVPLHGGRVGSRLLPAVDGRDEFPAIRLTLVATSGDHRWEDRSRVQVECYADEEEAASTLSRYVTAALSDLPGEYPDAGGTVTGYEVPLKRFASHIATTGRFRFVLDVTLTISPFGPVLTSD